MIVGSPGAALVKFAVPLAAGNILQQLYNIADTIIIGKFISSDALAAVGNATNITFLLLALATGFGMGTSIIISQYYGAGKYENAKTTIFTGLITSLLLGIFVMSAGLIFSKSLLAMMNTPADIISMAYTYIRIYLYGIIFLFIFNMCNSIFQAMGDSRTPFLILLFSSVLNIVMDLALVCKLRAGIKGAAYATILAEFISVTISVFIMSRRMRSMRTDSNVRRYSFSILKKICYVAVPSILQHSVMSLCNLSVQSLINSCGTTVIAGYTAANKVDSVASSPMVNIGNASSTFSAQNIGAKKYDRVKKGLHAAILLDVFISAAIVAAVFIFGRSLLGLFVKDSGMDVIDAGLEYLEIVCLANIIQGVMHIFGGVLRGAGDLRGFLTTFCGNMISRVVFSYVLFPIIGKTGIWISVAIGWFIGAIIGYSRYKMGKWQEKRLI